MRIRRARSKRHVRSGSGSRSSSGNENRGSITPLPQVPMQGTPIPQATATDLAVHTLGALAMLMPAGRTAALAATVIGAATLTPVLTVGTTIQVLATVMLVMVPGTLEAATGTIQAAMTTTVVALEPMDTAGLLRQRRPQGSGVLVL